MSLSLNEVWKTRTPLVWRGLGTLKVRLPYEADNGSFLRGLRKSRRFTPIWRYQDRYWETPAAWFNDLCKCILERFDELYLVQPHRSSEKCAPACWNARGLECECSCLGIHHGEGEPEGRWYVIDETYAVCWRNEGWRWSHLKSP